MVVDSILTKMAGSAAAWVAKLGFRRLHARWDPRLGLSEALQAVAPADRAKAEHYVKRLADNTAHELLQVMALEFRDLDDGEIQDALLSVHAMLERTDIAPDALVLHNLNAERFARSLWPPSDRFMSEGAKSVCERVLDITCRIIVDSARRLDAVQGAALSTLLNGQDAIEERLAKLVDQMQGVQELLRDRETRTLGTSRVRVPLPPLCAERDAEHDELIGRFIGDPHRPPAVLVIRGWPGVGKTTLVTHLAHDPRLLARYGVIMWVRAGEDATASTVLQQLAFQLGVTEPLPSGDGHAAKMLAALVQGRPEPTMIVCDDLWNADLGGLLLRLGPATLVVTTREPEVADSLTVGPQDVYLLRELDTDRGVRLLARFTPSACARHPERVRVLVEDVEGLPLALRVAGRMLEAEIAGGLGGELELFDELRETRKLLEQRAPQDRYDPATGSTPTVNLLMRRSTDRLGDIDRMRFARLGVFAPKPAMFDLSLLSAAWASNRRDTRETLRVLVNRGLVEALPGRGMFQTHSLLRSHARTLLVPDS